MSQSYRNKRRKGIEARQTPVHVCRQWRSLVLESPRRLNLRLSCTPETLSKDTLDVWPALPLLVSGNMVSSGTDDVIAALGQSNRVYQVNLTLAVWQLENVLAAMQVLFSELTVLQLASRRSGTLPVIPIPDSFLGGSAPSLRYFRSPIFHIPGTSHPKRWSLSSPPCPASKHSPFDSDPLNLALTGKTEVGLPQNTPSSPLSTNFISKALPNI
jgi:hypothetical protein